ncbi:MAG: aminopeptidase P family protein [Planctomycetaceae bacterium]|nr:aminopeptidase P family protein [Planctomycetaceae bacterium]
MSDRFVSRREKLLRVIKQAGVNALLVSGETNVSWLTGFSGDSTWLLLGPKVCVLVSDGRYETQISEECPGLDVVIRKPETKLHEAIAKVVQSAGIGCLGFESHLLTWAMAGDLQSVLPNVEFKPVAGKVEELRAVKDAEEIAKIRTAVDIAIRGFQVIRAMLTSEMTEVSVAHELEQTMRRFGAAGTSFETIVAANDRAALAHYRPGREPIGDCSMLLIDWGANLTGNYKSDLTRVLLFGKVTKKLAKVYQTVLEAQQRAIRSIRPGIKCEEVDKVAREYIRQQGYGRRFGHGLGHGIGLDIHEMPRLAPNSQTVLQPGMVVTVEPGIYLPRWGGVRIEDDILVTRDGAEVLSQSLPKDMESMLVD